MRIVYLQPQLIAIFFLGFSSGLPLSLTASTLFAWLAEVGVDKENIGFFAAIAMPYSLKFLWAPIMDSVALPWLGRRRGWLLLTQVLLLFSLMGFSVGNPMEFPLLFGGLALLVAFFSASQDVVIDAYRVEILPPEQQAAAAAMITLGYRIAMLVSGAGALWLSDNVSWQMTYLAMAGCMGVGIFTTLCIREPENDGSSSKQKNIKYVEWLKSSVIDPFLDFMTRPGWLAILFFVILFKLADAFLGIMFNPFLLELGFSKTQIAQVVKLYGLLATIGGSFIGGALVVRFGIYRILFITGIGHMLTNLLLVQQANLGADQGFLTLCVISENLTAGMGMAAFVAYLSSLCRVRYTATQYALLSSLATVARTLLSTESGYVAEWLGWQGFFLFSSLLAVPSLILLWWINRRFGMEGKLEAK